MAKVFVQLGSSFGMLSKFYPVIHQLSVLGHTVKYLSHSQNVKKYLAPLNVQPLSTEFTLLDRPNKMYRSNFYSPKELFEFNWFSDTDWSFQKINELGKQISEFEPDILLESWGLFTNIVSKLQKRKCVSITHSSFHPERLHYRLRWWDDNTTEIPSKLMDVINKNFSQNDVPTISKFEELFTGDYTLIPSIPELDPLTNVNAFNTQYVVPMIWDNQRRVDIRTLGFNPEWRTIFCYTGKLKNTEMLHILFEAFSTEKLNVLMSMGSQDEITIAKKVKENYQPFITNLTITTGISGSDAHNLADMIIHHGGYGSCISQLVYAKASLILPTNSEREYNARMCEKLDLGICIPIENANSSIIKEAIKNVLFDKKYINAAVKYNSLISERKYPTAGEIIEKALQ
jgi:UDP:flavonoid glycosyltransferase YjiC (YdhE family)